MFKRAFVVLSLASGIITPSVAADNFQLEKYVVLMRHGVRPPTNTKEITPLAEHRWPDWGVADGMLTPHGIEAASRLGTWEGQMLVARGLFKQGACPSSGEVFAWASGALQRTVDTGNAVLSGMFPGCDLITRHHDVKGEDPLFTASKTDVGRLDLAKGRAAILEAMGGSFEPAQKRVAPLMAKLQGILGCCAPAACKKANLPAPCDFASRPWEIAEKDDGRYLSIEGPLGQASTIAQVFLLEYLNGFGDAKLGWGRVKTGSDVIELSQLRQIKYEYFERVPYIARRGASNIFNQILIAIAKGAHPGGVDTNGGPPDSKLTLFVGSDTQIAEIGGMLGAHWTLKSYLPDETPPTGGLAFELLREKDNGNQYVRILFVTPALDQIRNVSVIDAANPPEVVTVGVPGCESSAVSGACPLNRFMEIAQKSLDPTATAKQSY